MRMFRRSVMVALSLALLPFTRGYAAVPSASPVSRAELMSEIDVKLGRVHSFLLERHLAGVLLTRVDNVSWITAGLASNMIVITDEIGASSLLIMQDGRKYVIANNSEMPRLLQGGFGGSWLPAEIV